MLVIAVTTRRMLGGGGQSEASVLSGRSAAAAARGVKLGRPLVVGFGAAWRVEVGLEVQAEILGQTCGRELGRGCRQPEVRKDLSHHGELCDVGDDRESRAAFGAVERVGEGAGDELGPGDAAGRRAPRRCAEAGDGVLFGVGAGVGLGGGGGLGVSAVARPTVRLG